MRLIGPSPGADLCPLAPCHQFTPHLVVDPLSPCVFSAFSSMMARSAITLSGEARTAIMCSDWLPDGPPVVLERLLNRKTTYCTTVCEAEQALEVLRWGLGMLTSGSTSLCFRCGGLPQV